MSAPCGQPPLCRRVGFASGSLAPCLHSATLHFARSLRSDMFSCCSFVALVLSRAIYVYLGLWVSLHLICLSSFVGFMPSCVLNDRTFFVLAPRPCSAGFCSYVSLYQLVSWAAAHSSLCPARLTRAARTLAIPPPPLAPLATLVPLRVAVSPTPRRWRRPTGGRGRERYFFLCGMPLARLRFFCSFRITSQITPLKINLLAGLRPTAVA